MINKKNVFLFLLSSFAIAIVFTIVQLGPIAKLALEKVIAENEPEGCEVATSLTVTGDITTGGDLVATQGYVDTNDDDTTVDDCSNCLQIGSEVSNSTLGELTVNGKLDVTGTIAYFANSASGATCISTEEEGNTYPINPYNTKGGTVSDKQYCDNVNHHVIGGGCKCYEANAHEVSLKESNGLVGWGEWAPGYWSCTCTRMSGSGRICATAEAICY